MSTDAEFLTALKEHALNAGPSVWLSLEQQSRLSSLAQDWSLESRAEPKHYSTVYRARRSTVYRSRRSDVLALTDKAQDKIAAQVATKIEESLE